MEYLKNLVLQLYTKGEAEALLPVFSTLLTFSKEENVKAQQVSRAGRLVQRWPRLPDVPCWQHGFVCEARLAQVLMCLVGPDGCRRGASTGGAERGIVRKRATA
jgi:hypothetical protein